MPTWFISCIFFHVNAAVKRVCYVCFPLFNVVQTTTVDQVANRKNKQKTIRAVGKIIYLEKYIHRSIIVLSLRIIIYSHVLQKDHFETNVILFAGFLKTGNTTAYYSICSIWDLVL